jgi:hypothetical protein
LEFLGETIVWGYTSKKHYNKETSNKLLKNNNMKKLLLLIGVLFSIDLLSQEIEFGVSTGSGFVYVVENSDNTVNINYNAPRVISSTLVYTPKESNVGIKLSYQNLIANLNGIDWQYGYNFNRQFQGSIENKTFIVGIEYMKDLEKLNFGYNIGVGQTMERINFDERGIVNVQNSFLVFNFGGLMKYKLNQKLSLNLEPSFLWNDPIRSFSRYYRLGGEDINFLIQLGLRYKL